MDLANWSLWNSPKFTTEVKFQSPQGIWPDQRSGNPIKYIYIKGHSKSVPVFNRLVNFFCVVVGLFFLSFLHPQTFRLLPQTELLAFIHSAYSYGAVYYCTTCANCENFLSERITSSCVMVIINGHQGHVT